MTKERLYIFDTTLRDGAQTQGVHFSIDEKTKKEHGPFINKSEAETLAKSLIQKNIDDFYHRAWVITKN